MAGARGTAPASIAGLWAAAIAVLALYLADAMALPWHWWATIGLLGGLNGYLLAQVRQLRRAVATLSATQDTTEQTSADAKTPAAARSAPEPAQTSKPKPATARHAVAPPASKTRPAMSAAGASHVEPAESRKPDEPGALDRAVAHAVEVVKDWLTGGNPLARVGIVVLFFGGVFLAKYSADAGLFPITARFAALALGAIALVVLGWLLHERRPIFGQILQGGGIAGFYLTVFTALRLFALLPPALAFVLMAGVAAAAAVLAVAEDSLALAVLGTVGGFAVPLLVSTGSGSALGLFGYYLILNLGIVIVAWFRAWRVLNLAGFVFTFGVSGLFRATTYAPEQLWITDGFLLLFFGLYVAVSILFSLRQKPDLKGYVSGSLVFGLPVAAFGLHASLVAGTDGALAASALGFGVFYALVAWALYTSGRDNLRLLCEAFAALALIFASLAVPLLFDSRTTTAMWAIEGAGLIWLGLRQRRLFARALGALLQALGGLGYFVDLHLPVSPGSALAGDFLATTLVSLGSLASGVWLYHQYDRLTRFETRAATVAGCWAFAWWLFGGLQEIDRALPAADAYGACLAFAAASVVIWHLLSRRVAWPLLDALAGGLLALASALGVVALVSPGLGHPAADLGWIGWPVLLIAGGVLLYRLERYRAWFDNAGGWPHAIGFWLVALLATAEIHWQLARVLSGAWTLLPWGLVPAVLVYLATRQRPRWPLAVHAAAYRLPGALPLALVVCAWIIWVNLTTDGSASGLVYLPLLNPVDIGTALGLAAVVDYWLALAPDERERIWAGTRHGPARVLAGGLFFWLTMALLRSIHQLAGVAWTSQAMTTSVVVQSALSITWGLVGIAAIIVAARRRERLTWLAGAALMAIVVLKLFIFDLHGTNTGARIVSFLSVGALLLLAGYLAPLPPRSETGERDA